MDRNDLVSVLTVQNPTQAEIIRGALESAGIPCEIGGETQAGFVGVAAMGIDVMTHAGDVRRARKHLRQLKHDSKVRRQRRAEVKKARDADAERLKNAIQEIKPPDQIQPPPKG
jgi:hypothetical protein